MRERGRADQARGRRAAEGLGGQEGHGEWTSGEIRLALLLMMGLGGCVVSGCT